MASLTMTASFLGGVAGLAERSPVGRRRLVVPKAIRAEAQQAPCSGIDDSNGSNGRRAVVLAVAAAAAAVSAVGAGKAVAVALEGEPKKGTPEAKKKYAPICVTMPTASICHK